jgi:hypothetical protein
MMLQRNVSRFLVGAQEEALKAMREEDNAALAALGGHQMAGRISTCRIGPRSMAAIDWLFESAETREAFWQAWFGTGRLAAWNEKWNSLSTGEVSIELYDVHASHTLEGDRNGISVRWTVHPSKGKLTELADFWTEWIVATGKYTSRVLLPQYGVRQRVMVEVDFANLADYEARVQAFNEQVNMEQFLPVHNALMMPHGTTEVWDIHS